jgi:hypothetical protein
MNKYSMDALKKELMKAGHDETDIDDAITEIKDMEKGKDEEDMTLFPDPLGDYSHKDKYKKAPPIAPKPIDKKPKAKEKPKVEEKKVLHKDHPNRKPHRRHYNPHVLMMLLTIFSAIILIMIIWFMRHP